MARASVTKRTGSKKKTATKSGTTASAGSDGSTKKRATPVAAALTRVRKTKRRYCSGEVNATDVREAARKYVAAKVAKAGKKATPADIKKTKNAAKKVVNKILTGKCPVKTIKQTVITKQRRKSPSGIKGLS